MRRYPIKVHSGTMDDFCSVEEHKKALSAELQKAKPRDSVLIPLLRSTFQERRMFVHTAKGVSEILDTFPVLHRPAMVCLHFIDTLTPYI